MLDAHPTAQLAVAVVWIPMLAGDDGRAAQEAASLVPDPPARHFFDAQRRAIARSLRTEGAAGQTAWDMYLFYAPTARWRGEHAETPPAPTDWLHQLRGRAWADRRRWRWGEGLASALLETADRLLAQ